MRGGEANVYCTNKNGLNDASKTNTRKPGDLMYILINFENSPLLLPKIVKPFRVLVQRYRRYLYFSARVPGNDHSTAARKSTDKLMYVAMERAGKDTACRANIARAVNDVRNTRKFIFLNETSFRNVPFSLRSRYLFRFFIYFSLYDVRRTREQTSLTCTTRPLKSA